MTAPGEPTYRPGDVVFGVDPFKRAEASRPWVVLSNHEGQPFHGEQYIVLSLTTRTWLNGLIEIDSEAWANGGTPEESRVVPWAVQSIDRVDIDSWQGRLVDEFVATAIDAFVTYLRA